MKQIRDLYSIITTIITTQNLTDPEIITREIIVIIIIIMYIRPISSNQVNGVVLGAGERTTPTDSSVSGVNYQKKIRGGEKTRSSIYQQTEEHRVPAERHTTDVYKRQIYDNKKYINFISTTNLRNLTTSWPD